MILLYNVLTSRINSAVERYETNDEGLISKSVFERKYRISYLETALNVYYRFIDGPKIKQDRQLTNLKKIASAVHLAMEDNKINVIQLNLTDFC